MVDEPSSMKNTSLETRFTIFVVNHPTTAVKKLFLPVFLYLCVRDWNKNGSTRLNWKGIEYKRIYNYAL